MQRVLEFHLLRQARDRYRFDRDLFLRLEGSALPDPGAVQELALRMERSRDASEPPVRPGQLHAVCLLHRLLHLMIDAYRRDFNPGVHDSWISGLDESLGGDAVEQTLKTFGELFPPVPVYRNESPLPEWLKGGEHGVSHRFSLAEQMLMVYLFNRNRAAKPFVRLFDESEISRRTPYARILEQTARIFRDLPAFGKSGMSLFDVLMDAVSGDSLEEQLQRILRKWGDVIGVDASLILRALDLMREDLKMGGWDKSPAEVLIYEYGGRLLDEYAEPERFTADTDWMPKAVILAKSVHVWLDQLSKHYKRHIHRLDQIPDGELDKLARWGFTGLWLIGLWERSPASRTIKQMRGNPDAAASAYSLYDYEISADLGGELAFQDLKRRAWTRGIRMATDIVPNHMGIYSKWVVEHPDWFLNLPEPPYPVYSFNGPELSWDERVSIKIEDGYWEERDAAVVFQRLDRWTGNCRFIYHGNDGTSTPWNDTAQLDFLKPEVREAVIRLIVDVAKKCPIIRFDAAMTLTKKHYQRLWFPKPGDGGAIPSRAMHGLTREQFDKHMPEEFWREVVDRIAVEAPDTLLIAEAFWLLEGFFVRTLGMHRVYNSAFMNMLKDEDNAKYRSVIKNTLEFDPRILQRFVNFMNNPDEETAVAQFGKGDKYFGTAMMMVTMPGLPMFGHGQVEGFSEKYGMEYQRAYYDETVDEGLVARHEHEIFPLMRRRELFAGVENFLLYDFFTDVGYVDENVFAFSNRRGEDRGLVLYHNAWAETAGWIRISAAYADLGSGEKKLVQKSLAEGLAISGDSRDYYIFRDNGQGLDYLRSGEDINRRGLRFELKAYQHIMLTDIRHVRDDGEGRYRRLCERLNGQGIPSIDRAYREMKFEKVLNAYAVYAAPEVIRNFWKNSAKPGAVAEFAERARPFLEAAAETGNTMHDIDGVVRDLARTIRGTIALGDFGSLISFEPSPPHVNAIRWLTELADGTPDAGRLPWRTLGVWLTVCLIGKLQEKDFYPRQSAQWLEEWVLLNVIERTLAELGAQPVQREVDRLRIMVAHQHVAHTFRALRKYEGFLDVLNDPVVFSYLGTHSFNGILWFNRESLEELTALLFLTTAVVCLAEDGLSPAERGKEIADACRSFRQIEALGYESEYKYDRFRSLLGYVAGYYKKPGFNKVKLDSPPAAVNINTAEQKDEVEKE